METPTEKDLPTGPESSILVYKLDTQKPLSELEQKAKSLDLPDVVVEYIRQTLLEVPSSKPQEVIVVRTPSSVSLREGGKDALDKGDNVRFLDALSPSLSASQSSLGYPRSVPPSPNFGYRPLESETSAVYTIISPCVKREDKEREMILMAQALKEKEKAIPRRFEFSPNPPVDIERKRKSLQFATDVCSLFFLVPGILIALLTPIIIIPMFILPLKHYVPLIGAFLLSGTTAVVFLALSGLVGNIVWHWDPEEGRLRPRLHCGTGPLKHFFGKSFRDTPGV